MISDRLRAYDQHSILITEELDAIEKRRWPTDSDPARQPLMFFSDPTDRSKFLKMLLVEISQGAPTEKIGRLFQRPDLVQVWEKLGGAPADITGATSSITCVRKGSMIFSVILNYITGTVFVASPSGVFYLRLPNYQESSLDSVDLDTVFTQGKTLDFPSAQKTCVTADDFHRFTTFLGKTGYRENFLDSHIFVDDMDRFLHHSEPGGPARPLYLSELQNGNGPIGFVMANGEKISEWIHWLAFVKFAKNSLGERALRIFEISLDRPWTKDGVLMSTSEPYSIFCGTGETAYLDISRLRTFGSPSRFRSMLVVTTWDNEYIIHIMRKFCYREVTGSF
ncbi:MAG: hypothetical protein NTU97_00790 [Candidatus Magasanikbacteria bacterium]|nr:hypothetical protein [Candidatus Magasanikbacteria bacterium]